MKNLLGVLFVLSCLLSPVNAGFLEGFMNEKLKDSQQWKEKEVPLILESVLVADGTAADLANAIEASTTGKTYVKAEENDFHDIRLKIKKTNSSFELKNIEYVIQIYNEYGEPILKTGENVLKDSNPGFFMDTTEPQLKHVVIKEKPVSVKVWIKRYVTKDGKLKVVSK